MNGLRRDLRDAWRGLSSGRGLTAAAVVMLTVGLGTATAIFAVLQAIVLKLPFDAPERIATIRALTPDGRPLSIGWERYLAWRELETIEALGAFRLVSPVLTGQGAAIRLTGEAITPSMFAVLGVQPLLGRTFAEADQGVAVLSHARWRTTFAADAAILGRPIALDGKPVTVIGVMPPDFEGPRSRPGDLWVPLPPNATGRAAGSVSVVARLRPGTAPPVLAARLEASRWDEQTERWRATVTPAREDLLYREALGQMKLVGGGVALLFVMTCVNVAGLLLARNLGRRREYAMRMALGAERHHLLRQVILEGALLATAAFVLAVPLGSALLGGLAPMMPPAMPRLSRMTIDAGVVLFAAVAAGVSALLVSVWPAWAAANQDPASAIRSGGRGSSRGLRRLATGVIVVQAALASVVLAGAALLVGAFLRINPTDPGFALAGRVKFSVELGGPRYAEPAARASAAEEIASRLGAIPGVDGVTAVTSLPLTGSSVVFPVRLGGSGGPQAPTVHFRAALPGYFSLMEIPILVGRALDASDTRAAAQVAVVNESFVSRVLRGRDPIGAEVVIEEGDSTVVRRVVGVARDVRLFGPDLRPRPEVFVPYAQSPLSLVSFVVRTAGAADLAPGIHGVMAAFDATVPVDRLETLGSIASRSVRLHRFFAALMGIFAIAAMLLAFVGLYGVSTWAVGQRTREFGIRMALGAAAPAIGRLVLAYGAGVGLAGAICGVSIAFLSAGVLEAYLAGFPARPPALFAAIAILFTLVVSLATWWPARRAARLDPVRALQAE